LNTDSDEADVTSLGRPFHTFAPATGKARPPIVDRRQVGTSSLSVEADLSLRRCGMCVCPGQLSLLPHAAQWNRKCTQLQPAHVVHCGQDCQVLAFTEPDIETVNALKGRGMERGSVVDWVRESFVAPPAGSGAQPGPKTETLHFVPEKQPLVNIFLLHVVKCCVIALLK